MAEQQVMEIDQKELEFRTRLYKDFKFYAPKVLRIRSKSGRILPLRLNKAQQYIHDIAERQLKDIGKVRIIVLKGRQQGMSTYIEGRFYWKVTHRRGVRAFILTHEQKATENLFEMASRYHDLAMPEVRPTTGASNAKELLFSRLDSGYKVGTAGSKGTGRSSTIQFFHGSEAAFWPNAADHATGIMQAIPDEPDTEVFLESTAYGPGNYFHTQWVKAENGETDYIAVFIPWFWQDEYKRPVPAGFDMTDEEINLLKLFSKEGLTLEHLVWRRHKIAELDDNGGGEFLFKQEYPFTAAEAFQTSGEDSLIAPERVLRARKAEGVRASGAKIVGVDPARFGRDATAIAFRQGRVCTNIIKHYKKSTMQIAGICARILRDPVTEEDTDIDMMFVDEGGLGAGVVDRLHELGFEERVVGVNFGSAATEPEHAARKRDEIWGHMRDWFDMLVSVPDEDGLQASVCQVKYSYDSANRLVIEQKKKTIERIGFSPDEGDSLALTFSEPVERKGLKHRFSSVDVVDPVVGY